MSRSGGKVVGDYTTVAAEDEFSFFPGLLEGAAFYKQALANGDARIVGQGSWDGHPVYWLELEKGGGLILRIGIARDSYRPVVFRALNPDGTPAGAQVAILGFDYVSDAQAAFDNDASVLVDWAGGRPGLSAGQGARRTPSSRTRVTRSMRPERSPRSARGQTGPSSLMADPRRSPFREALARSNGPLNIDVNAIANKDGVPKLIGFTSFSRMVKGGRWRRGRSRDDSRVEGLDGARC